MPLPKMARMIIEFVGPPGSGKTTLYERMATHFAGTTIPAPKVNKLRLKLLGLPLRTGLFRNDKNLQRVMKLSDHYRQSKPGEELLVEKGIYNLLYVMYVRGQRLRTSVGFKLSEKPTHLVALVRPGTRRKPADSVNNERFHYDEKILPFYEAFVSGRCGGGPKVLVLDQYSSIEEDFRKILEFVGVDDHQE